MLSSFFGVVYFEKPAGAESRLGLEKIINKSLDKLSHWDFKYKNIWVNQAADKGYVGLGEISNNPESKSNVEKYNCVSDALESLDTASLDNFSNLDTDFAFGHWLESEQKLICARDHIGIRPLFYTKTENYFAFASEIKALLVLDDVKKDIISTSKGCTCFY